jgi:Fe-S-cluster containining protein
VHPLRETDSPSWYRAGLRFECSRCGRCCRGAGNVWVSDSEIAELARELELSEGELRALHTRHSRRAGHSGVVLRQKRNQDCVFWDDARGCRVYRVRPRQCRTYPFWQAVVSSPGSWEAEGEHCPGIGHGPVHAADAIGALAAEDGIPRARTRRKLAKR